MLDRIKQTKQWAKEHPVQSAFIVGAVAGAVVMNGINIKRYPMPDLSKASFYIPEPYFEGLMDGRKIKLNTELGSFVLAKTQGE